MKPLQKNIILQAEKKDTISKSGIIIPDTVDKESPETAKVIEIGKDVKEIAVNDIVIFKKWSANEIEIDTEKYIVITEDDVMAIV